MIATKPNNNKNIFIISILTLILIFLDQISKYFADKYLTIPSKIIGNFFTLEKSQNSGVAFGITFNREIIIIVTVILIILIIQIIRTELNIKNKLSKIVSSLVLSGAISNLIDRLVYGKVIDFLHFQFWPIFNLADIFIVAGIFGALIFYKKIKIPSKT